MHIANTPNKNLTLRPVMNTYMKAILMALLGISTMAYAQTGKSTYTPKLYNPYANAAHDLDSVMAKAKAENKHVLVQVGGNWCSWCTRMHQFINANGDLKRALNMDYVVYHLNYSSENSNTALLAKYRHPERFGFPVLLVLDAEGTLLHTQDTTLLEDGAGYSKPKILEMIRQWTVRALKGMQ